MRPIFSIVMDFVDEVLTEVDAFVLATGLAETTLCSRALKDSRVTARIRAGKTVTIATITRLRSFMREELARRRRTNTIGAMGAGGRPSTRAGARIETTKTQGRKSKAARREVITAGR
jgi:hypothetical protein